MGVGEMMLKQSITDAVVAKNAERNKALEFADMGTGPLLPPASAEEESKREEFAQRDLEYPELQLIVCRKAVVEGEKDETIAYMNGVEGFAPCLTIRLNDLKAGEYYLLYKPDFKPWHKVRRLNLVFYS